jgi:hypothetical protein
MLAGPGAAIRLAAAFDGFGIGCDRRQWPPPTRLEGENFVVRGIP